MNSTDPSGRRRPTPPSRLLAVFVSTALVLGVVASGTVIPVVALAGATVTAGNKLVSGASDSTDSSVPVALPQTSVMLAADGSTIAYFYNQNRTDVALNKVSPLMQQAIVSIEDSRFYQHGAIDPRGLARAALNNVTGGSVEGGSTLSQQYAKNLLLQQAIDQNDVAAEQAAVERTSARKLRELRLAVNLESRMSKQQILEGYLNVVYFGQNSYGVEAAAQRYFGVSAAHLTLPQSALLAGMVQDPTAYDPIAHPKQAKARRNVVLKDMRTQGKITQAQYTGAIAAKVKVTGSALPNGCNAAGTDGFFCQYTVQSILTSKTYSWLGATSADRQRALQSGGLVIHTTLQPKTQKAAVSAVNKHIPATDSSGLATTAVTVQPGTGAVVSMAEDRKYSVSGGKGKTSVNYAVDSSLGGGSGFQTGSSFKPFTLATWLDQGGSLNDTVNATRRAFPFSDFTACGQSLSGSQPYTPGNSEGTESGQMSVLKATADSVNVAYVDMESQLDLCDIASMAGSLGVHLATAQQQCSTAGKASTKLPTCLPSLTLGVEDIAPLTMAAAYAGFASGGVYCTPEPITSISRKLTATTTGTVAAGVHKYSSQCNQALTPDVASGVNSALKHVLTSGTAAAVGPLSPWPSAGKTGTTNGPYDTWFVGYTAQLSTAVWVGDPGHTKNGNFTRRQQTNITVNGRYYSVVFGASIAAPIWKSMMSQAMKKLPSESLP